LGAKWASLRASIGGAKCALSHADVVSDKYIRGEEFEKAFEHAIIRTVIFRSHEQSFIECQRPF
jgi:hypothetical protein